MTKRIRTDSVKGQLKAMKNAMTEIPVPKHCSVPDDALPFWDELMQTRPADSWTPADLSNAANMARTKQKIEQIAHELSYEGDIILNARGTQAIVNPKHQLLETLTKRVTALSRLLHVHANATVDSAAHSRKKATAVRDAKRIIDDIDDDLIPRSH